METKGFFNKDDIESELLCCFCKRRFDVPKNLPCGDSICTACESSFYSDNSKPCLSCQVVHEKPANGFPISKLIQNLLQKATVNVYRGQAHEKATREITDIHTLCEDFKRCIDNSENEIITYCDLMRNNVDIETESLIASIHSTRDKLLETINSYETASLKCNIENAANVPVFLKGCLEKHAKWIDRANHPSLHDNEFNSIQMDASMVKTEIELRKSMFQKSMFNGKRLVYYERKADIDSSIVGFLSATRIPNESYFRSLLRNPKCAVLDLKTEGKHAFAFKMSNDVYSVGGSFKHHLEIRLVKKSGHLLKKTELRCKYICSAFHNDQLFIAYSPVDIHRNEAANAGSEFVVEALKNLEKTKAIVINEKPISMFANQNKIFILTKAVLHVYDEFLKYGKKFNLSEYYTDYCIKYERTFCFIDNVLYIFDLATNGLLNTVTISKQFSGFIFKPTSKDTFLMASKNGNFCLFDLNFNCLMDFEIKIDAAISNVSINEDGTILLIDVNKKLYEVERGN